jgi:hypothetical protein
MSTLPQSVRYVSRAGWECLHRAFGNIDKVERNLQSQTPIAQSSCDFVIVLSNLPVLAVERLLINS